MRIAEVQVGKSYRCRVSGKWTTLQVLTIQDYRGNGRGRLARRIHAVNLSTGRAVTLRSAARLTRCVDLEDTEVTQ